MDKITVLVQNVRVMSMKKFQYVEQFFQVATCQLDTSDVFINRKYCKYSEHTLADIRRHNKKLPEAQE